MERIFLRENWELGCFTAALAAIFTFLTFQAGRKYAKAREAHVDRENRIERVVVFFLSEDFKQYPEPICRLIVAGILELESDQEILEACEKIVRRGHPDPLREFKSCEKSKGIAVRTFLETIRGITKGFSIRESLFSKRPLEGILTDLQKDKVKGTPA